MLQNESFTELPLLSTHGALLLHLLSCQPLQNTMHVETVTTMTRHCVYGYIALFYESCLSSKCVCVGGGVGVGVGEWGGGGEDYQL